MSLFKTLAVAALFAQAALSFPSEGIQARAPQDGMKHKAQACVDSMTKMEACLNAGELQKCLVSKGIQGTFNAGWKEDTCYATIYPTGFKPFQTLLPPTDEQKKIAQACVDGLTTKDACYSDELNNCLSGKGLKGTSNAGWKEDTCYASVYPTGYKPFLTLLPASAPTVDDE